MPARPSAPEPSPAGPSTTARPAARRGAGAWLTGGAVSLWRSFSGIGLILGALFFAASLTPSLIPRSFLVQGALAGVCFAAGYGIGVLLEALWSYLGFRIPSERVRRNGTWAAAAGALVIVASFAWRAEFWQNSIRERVAMPPTEGARPLEVVLIAFLVFVLLVMIFRFFALVARRARRRAGRYVPERVSLIVGVVVALIAVALIGNGVLLTAFRNMSDRSFAAFDALIQPEFPAPSEPERTGSAASLIDWKDLGRAGREFVVSGPTRADLEAFLGRPALQPIRVYAGLNSAEDPEARARLALEELIRAGGFDRSVLVVAVPTGTGWMDPAATDPLEYLHGGDTAIVAVQYSYLTSPLSLLFEPGFARESGRAVFREIYRHWTALPEDERPRLYLYGLSLGAYGSEQSARLHEVLADPFNGALWVGAPFATPAWRAATLDRNPGSTEWLPMFGDGSIIRFTNQENHLDIPGAVWGPMRIVYLQYASDPITFFSPASFWRKPDWMSDPIGPDVSPELRWFPVVTGLQLALDMAIGLAVPMGHGHLYAPEHHVDPWREVTAAEGWSPEELERLKAHLAE